MESGKSVKRDKIIFAIIYNRYSVDIGKIMNEEYLNLKTVMKNPSLKDILVSTRQPTSPVTL